jgi:hypothetical protein
MRDRLGVPGVAYFAEDAPQLLLAKSGNQGIPLVISDPRNVLFWNGPCQASLQMDLTKIISVLRDERERVIAAITTIERLVQKDGSRSSTKKRGRPPGSKNKPKASTPQD